MAASLDWRREDQNRAIRKAVEIGYSPITVNKCLFRACYVWQLAKFQSLPSCQSTSDPHSVTPLVLLSPLISRIWPGWSHPLPWNAVAWLPGYWPLLPTSFQLPWLLFISFAGSSSCPRPQKHSEIPCSVLDFISVSTLTPFMIPCGLLALNIIHMLRFLKFVSAA